MQHCLEQAGLSCKRAEVPIPKKMTFRPSQIRASAAESTLMVPDAFQASGHYRDLDLPTGSSGYASSSPSSRNSTSRSHGMPAALNGWYDVAVADAAG